MRCMFTGISCRKKLYVPWCKQGLSRIRIGRSRCMSRLSMDVDQILGATFGRLLRRPAIRGACHYGKGSNAPQALHLYIYEFVKEYVHNHTASEQDLAQAIQGLNLPYLTCDATTAVNQLIWSGTLELREGRCCWKISVQPPCNASHQRPRKKARRGH